MRKVSTPFPELDIDSKRVKATKIIMKSLMYSFAMFGLLFIILLLAILGFLKQDRVSYVPVPKEAVLHINFDNSYTETRTDDLLSELAEIKSTSFYDLVRAINIASMDSRVKAVTANVSMSGLGLAQVQELRKTISTFRASGKKAYIYSSGFGSFGGGMKEYYLASVFDEIWLLPNSQIGITGVGFEVPFFRGLLDKVGVEPEFYSRYEYKTAVASLTNKNFDKNHKEEITKLGSSIFGLMVRDISHANRVEDTEFKKLVDKAPLSSDEALNEKLVTKLGYRQEFMKKVTDNGKLKVVEVEDYIANFADEREGKFPKIALLVLDGVITEGESKVASMGDAVIGSDTVAKQIEEISKEKNLKALIVRVNSPGGSYSASQEIWYAISKIKGEKEIPVVVSMGDYAASGGYFVSLAGDYIFAQEATITGSIGVLGGKFVLKDLWKKIGVNWGEVKFGDNSTVLSVNHKFSKKEAELFNKSLDIVYKDFVAKVSGARGIDLDTMDKYARGRIWTGYDAKENGLVDAIGGINEALAKAKAMSGIKANAKFNIVYYPKKKSLQEKIAELIGGRPSGASVSAILDEVGLNKEEFSVLQRLKYDAILPPMIISY